jgi:hypothetical protein
MLTLFPPGLRPKIEVVATDKDFWKKISRFCAPVSVFDAQGDDHGNIDLRLVRHIESYLIPVLGAWERSDIWWHQMDVYGDGVRSLIFRTSAFKPRFVVDLHSLLKGEHADFCIVCQIHDSIRGDEDTKLGSIAIRAEKIMACRPVIKFLAEHA